MSVLLVVTRVVTGTTTSCRRCLGARRGVKMMPARTINPGEPKTCERPRQVQMLVNAATRRSCPQDNSPMSHMVTRVVPVRICRRTDLERGCRPKLCECPKKRLPLTFAQRIRCIVSYGVKGLTIAGLIYWTKAEGVWGSSKDTEDFYLRISEAWDPCPDGNNEKKLPHLEVMKFKIIDSYNHAVIAVMGLLADIPIKLSRAINDYLHPCEPIIEEDEEEEIEFKFCD